MSDDSIDFISITKLDAARRQIETAVTLWFHDGDPVAIHTLTAAGHQICRAITTARGENISMLFNMDWLPEAFQQEYKQLILRPENFFKHATKDPDPSACLRFGKMATKAYLLDAIYLFHRINSDITPAMMAFWAYFEATNPDLLKHDALGVGTKRLSVEMRAVPKRLVLKEFLKASARLARK